MKFWILLIAFFLACADDPPRNRELRVVVNEFARIEKLQVPDDERNRQSMLKTLYSTILDDSGALGGGFANRFYWRGDDLHLHMERDIQTIDGWIVGVDDAVMSLKVYLANKPFATYAPELCGMSVLASPHDACPGIKKKSPTKLILTFKGNRNEFLEWLSTVFVVPQNAFDENWRIVDHRNTSGPYHLLKTHPTAWHMTLVRNKSHWHLHPEGPARIIFFVQPDEYQGILKKDVDVSWWYPEEFYRREKGSHLYCEQQPSIEMIRFSDLGMTMPIEKRQDFVRHVRATYPGHKQLSEGVRYWQYQHSKEVGYLQQLTLGRGTLSKAQLIEFQRLLDLPPKRNLKSLNHKGVTPWWLSFRALDIPFDKTPITNSSVQRVTKPGMTLNVIQLSYDPFSSDANLKSALFGDQVFPPHLSVRGKEAEKWWQAYESLKSPQAKLEMIRQLHFDSLIGNPSVVPVMQTKNCRFVSSRWDAGEFMNWRVLSYAHYRRQD